MFFFKAFLCNILYLVLTQVPYKNLQQIKLKKKSQKMQKSKEIPTINLNKNKNKNKILLLMLTHPNSPIKTKSGRCPKISNYPEIS